MRLFAVNLLLLLAVVSVDSMPYMLLKNKAPKCFLVEAQPDTTLIVTYHCPDMVIIEDEEEPAKKLEEEEKGTAKIEDGLDSRYNEKYQKRMDTLKRAHLKDINISITPRDASGAMISHRVLPQGIPGTKLPTKKREQVVQNAGSFEYETGQLEGSVEVCIQSYTASADSPSRVGLDIVPRSENDEIEKMLEEERRSMNELLTAENVVVKEETSRITADLARMQRRAKSIAGDAQFSKQRELVFHKQSITLNKAVSYWPLARVVVLLIGGYLQVTHVIQYMKSRHIY